MITVQMYSSYYALKSYRRILKLLERDATDVDRFMEQMKADMKELMEGSGPFGRQITGGNNLGENEGTLLYPG